MKKAKREKHPLMEWRLRLDAGAIRNRVLEIAQEIMPGADIIVERRPAGIEVGTRGGTMMEIPESVAGAWPPWAVAFFVAGILWHACPDTRGRREKHDQMDGCGD